MVFVESLALDLVEVAQQQKGEQGEHEEADLDRNAGLPGQKDHGAGQAQDSGPNYGADTVEKCMHLAHKRGFSVST